MREPYVHVLAEQLRRTIRMLLVVALSISPAVDFV
jgi:hypothetical protein